MKQTLKTGIALTILTVSALAGAMMLTGCQQPAPAPEIAPVAEAAEVPIQAQPVVEEVPREFKTDRVTGEISEISPSHIAIRYQILQDPETAETNHMGCFTLEKQAGEGWEALTPLVPEIAFDESPVSSAGKGYTYDARAQFSGIYGMLIPGVYRIHWNLLHGEPPVTIPFTLAQPEDPEAAGALVRIIDGFNEINSRECFQILHTDSVTGEPSSYRRYLKSGEDRLAVTYFQSGGEPAPINGAMVREGVPFRLTHEDLNTSDSPLWGWEPGVRVLPGSDPCWWMPPMDSLDRVHFTEITPEKITCHTLLPAHSKDVPDPFRDTSFLFDREGALIGIHTVTTDYAWNIHGEYDETKYYSDMEVLEGSQATQVLAAQKAAPVRPFSWQEDQKAMQAEAVPFQNTESHPVTDAIQALDRAQAEVSREFDGTVVYYDPDAEVWKVEFQMGSGWQGYEYVYLDREGITQMIALAGPKEQWYPES